MSAKGLAGMSTATEKRDLGAGKRVVVADDAPFIRHIVCTKLRNAGYEAIPAADGEEALELCRTEKPDLLITDFQMPIMTGLQLCKHLRASDKLRHIPAVMLTARGFEIDSEEMTAAGIAAVLAKPFSPRELLEKVSELLGASAAPGAP